MRSLKTKVRLKNGPQIIVPLNTGAEINMMIKEIIEDIGLIMR